MGLDGLLQARRIAVVGVAKNCGKTTTLNFLLRFAASRRRCVGLMSIGIDGEAEDVLLGTPKPPIHVEAGQWIVTAEEAAHASSAVLEYHATLGFETPLGDVVVTRVVEPGEVILAGLRHRADVKRAIRSLEDAGVDLVLVDGAYGRIAAAHCDVTDGVIISTGAVVSPSVDGIVDRTQTMLQRLTLPVIEEPWQRALLDEASLNGQSLLGGPHTAALALPAKSALVGLPKSRDLWTQDIQAIAIPGLVSDRVVDELVRAGGKGRTLLLADGTSLQTDGKHLERLLKHWNLRVGQPTHVLGISVNPTSVQGWTVSEQDLVSGLSARWPKIAIFNPKYGLESAAKYSKHSL